MTEWFSSSHSTRRYSGQFYVKNSQTQLDQLFINTCPFAPLNSIQSNLRHLPGVARPAASSLLLLLHVRFPAPPRVYACVRRVNARSVLNNAGACARASVHRACSVSSQGHEQRRERERERGLHSSATSSTSADSDIEELYESFDFEDDASHAHAGADEPVHSSADFRAPPLYSGALVTAAQSNLLLFQYTLRHSLTMKAVTELLQLLSVHLPREARIPKSVHTLKRFILESFRDAVAERHFYCGCCQRPLPSEDARCSGLGCSFGDKPSVFITVPNSQQLKRIIEGMVYVVLLVG